jgi:hypothetical protein
MNNVEQKAKEFAKQCKISQAKAMAFAESILAEGRASAPKAGRKVTDEALRIRSWLEEHKNELRSSSFTVKQICEKIKAEPAYVNNALHSVEGFATVGKIKAGRGRPAVVWAVA